MLFAARIKVMINVKINSSHERVEKYDIKIDRTYSDFSVQLFIYHPIIFCIFIIK